MDIESDFDMSPEDEPFFIEPDFFMGFLVLLRMPLVEPEEPASPELMEPDPAPVDPIEPLEPVDWATAAVASASEAAQASVILIMYPSPGTGPGKDARLVPQQG